MVGETRNRFQVGGGVGGSAPGGGGVRRTVMIPLYPCLGCRKIVNTYLASSGFNLSFSSLRRTESSCGWET